MNLFQLIKADTACTDLLGSNPVKFFEFGTAPDMEQAPYATWQILAGEPFNYLAGQPSTDLIEAQIDVWGATAAEVRAACRAIRRALDPYITITHFFTQFDEESRLYRCVLRCTYTTEI